MKKVVLKKKISQHIANGHPWIFANEVETIDNEIKAGEIVEVFFYDGKFVGKGYINTRSQIVIRLLTRNRNA